MKVLRSVAGGAILAGGLYVVVGEHMAGVSADATVNARLTTVRAAIDGVLEFDVNQVRARVGKGQSLGRITDIRADAARLADIERVSASLKSEIERLAKQRAAAVAARQMFQERTTAFQAARIDQLEARAAEAEASLDASAARFAETWSSLERTHELMSRGVQTATNLARARSLNDIAGLEVRAGHHRISFLNAEIDAAKKEIYLADSVNDAPYSLQRLREVDLKIGDADAELEHLRRREQQADEQIAFERMRFSRLSIAEISANSGSLTWDYLASDGEMVRKGQDLARLVDCATTFVTASVGERLYNTLKVGDAAQFRLYGESNVYPASVTRLAGASSPTRYEHFAVAPTSAHLKLFDVMVAVPALRDDTRAGCEVGRTGRIVFSSGASNLLATVSALTGL